MTIGLFSWPSFGRAPVDPAPNQILPGAITYIVPDSWRGYPDADENALKRAKALLLALLTPEERERFELRGALDITSPTGNRYFYDGINFSQHGADWFQPACIQVDYRFEAAANYYDRMVTFLLWMRGNEDELRKKANWARVRYNTKRKE